MSTVPANELSPGDVILMGEYPCDLIDVSHDATGMTYVRWSVCPRDVMWVSSNTPINVLGRLDD